MNFPSKCFVASVALLVVGCGRINYDPVPRADGSVDALLDDASDMNFDAENDLGDGASGDAADSAMDMLADMPGTTPGIVVTPTSGLTTTEAGGTATFTVVLATSPIDDVVIDLSSSDTDEGTAAPARVTFTMDNWDAPQTITVSGVDDSLRDGNVDYTIITAAAMSGDDAYNGMNAEDVTVTNIDDESPGVTLSRTSGLMTTEAGGSDAFTIQLNVAPAAGTSVTISVMSDRTSEATVDVASVVFNETNWSSAQTVTVTGVDDVVIDGDQPFVIVTGDVVSDDLDYNGLAVSDVTGVNLDDESPGIVVSPTSGLMTTEAGGTATFTVVLQSEPESDVMIAFASDDTTEGTISPASVTFTPTNWNVPQVMTVTGVDDLVADGDQMFQITVGPSTSGDFNYDGLSGASVSVTNADDESAGVVLTPMSGLVTSESGGTATFTVVLRSEPTASVMFNVTSTNTDEGTVAPASLTFTTSNWDDPQTVTVTGVDDLVADGDQMFDAVVHVSGSGDPNYAMLADRHVEITNTDNETAGITVTPTSGLTTTETGGTATFTIVLNSQPTADVSIALSSDVPLEGTPSPTNVTFTMLNWNMPQTITVTGADDAVADGSRVYHIVTAPASSADTDYDTFNASDVTVNNTDNDSVGVTVTPTSGLTTTEAGGAATFTMVLASQPTANVVFNLSSSDTTEGTVSPASVLFTMGNWNVPQTVTVSGVDDLLADGNVLFSVVTMAAVSTDSAYSGFNPSDVTVTNVDNDMAGVVVTPTSGLVTTEGGEMETFTVVLTAEPSANVTISITSSDTTEGTASPASLMFTTANWNMPQTVSVTGVDDSLDDGDIAYSIVTGAAVSTDAAYSALAVSDVSVTNTDDDSAGVTVTPTLGLVTTEALGTASFTVVLTSQPSANVTISIMSSDTSEGTVAPASLVFTTGNWSVAQTVTITGVDDALADGNIAYTVVTGATVSTDTTYSGRVVPDVAVTNNDNDAPGVNVSPTAGLTTSEFGVIANFTVVLASMPTASVSISIASSDTTEGTVSTASLMFTTGNWNMPQTVSVTGIDDSLDDGDIAYTITTGAAVSTDMNYSGRVVDDVAVTNTDNDTAGVTVSPTTGLVTTESGGTATFTIALTSLPSANVSIALSSSNMLEGTVSPASVTFTTMNWSTPQTVTVTGVNDFVVDGNIAYAIITGDATSGDATYNGMAVTEVSVTNTDNDMAGVTVTPTSGLVTTEALGTAAFTVVLTSQPSANVSISLMSSNTLEGTVSPASLTFTSLNWNMAQTVTVTGVNDFVVDGSVGYSVVTGAATSADANYNARAVDDVSVTNTDNDTAGVTVTPTSGLTTTEAGGTANFTVVLTSQPTAGVSIAISSSNTGEGTVSPASIAFTTMNWSTPQTVTITGVNDAVDDGDIAYTIITGAGVSTDTNYSGRTVSDVSVTNTDNDTAGITVTPTSGLMTTEAGGTASFTIVLTSQPTASVSISLMSSNTGEGTVSPASLTFTTMNWSSAQTVTITGVNDSIDDGDLAYTIVTGAASSSDSTYNNFAVSDVSVTNTDNDTVGVTVTPTSGLMTTEAGGMASFTIVLNSQPTASVSISLMSSNTNEGTVSPASVTFTTMNWSMAQTVTVTGVNDAVDDGNIAYTIVTGAASSPDGGYNGLAVSDVSVTNTDNDSSGVTVTPTSGLVTTEALGTANFTVVLTSQPTASVSISLMSSNTNEGTVSPASLTVTTMNWSMAQTVTITGVNDSLDDGDVAYTIVTGAASSADGTYNGMVVSDVSVTNTDNDTAGVTVTPTTGLVTTEALGTANFTIVLASQPSAGVTISVMSSNTAEGTVSAAMVSFTTMNWSTPQMITVTGVDDLAADGNIAYTIVTGAASSADPTYNGMAVSDVSVTNNDDDAPGVTVNPTGGLTTTEVGGMATFTIVLASLPSASVSINLMSSNTAEGTISPSMVTFTTMNWSTPQTITITGQNDFVDDGDVAYSIITSAATSADPGYSGRAVADVAVTNIDNDSVGVTVTPTSGLTTTEAGGTASFTIVLTSQPTASVSISLMSSNTAEGTVSAASVMFTTMNWSTPQMLTVTGQNDFIDDGDIAYTITTGAASSADGNYNGMAVSDVSVTNTDNDAVGVTVSPTSGLMTTEAGGTANFTIVLTSQPSASVTISLMSSNTAEGTVSPASVTFTTMNWSSTQMVTVTGQNDAIDDGDVGYSIVTGAASSADGAYNGMTVSDVSVTNTDNDTAGVTVNPTSGLTTTEVGGTANFTIVLTSQPTASVSISVGSSNTAEGTVSAGSVTFTTMNWSTPQMITVTGVDDLIDDGNVGYSIVTGAASTSDATYNGMVVSDVSVTNTDNDTGGITVTPTSGRVTTEVGGSDTFTIVLNTQPTASVTINLSSSDTTEGTISPASVTFTTMNWSMAQTVTLTGVDDFIDDGNISYSAVTAAASSADSVYNGMASSDVTASNTDNDTAGITVSPTSGLTTTEAGGTANFTIVLLSEPTANVSVSLASSNTSEGTVSPASVTFTNMNWSMAQTVTVTGVDDLILDGNIQYTITTGAASSADSVYNGMAVSDVSVTNTSPFAQEAYIKASNTNANDQFGQYGVVLSDDGNTLAVSAYNEASSATGINGAQGNNSAATAGAVYVFVRSAGVWTQEAYIKASNTQAGDNFGGCVALSGDGNTLAVCADHEDSSATGIDGNQASNGTVESGAVYVFTRSGATWSQQAYVKASTVEVDDGFGYAIVLSTTGDTMAVTSVGEDSNATGINGNEANNSSPESGATYVFQRTAGVWAQQAYIKASNTGPDGFGNVVAIAGDGDTIAVGSQYESGSSTGINGPDDNGASSSGAVYVFERTAGVWAQQAYVKASNTQNGDNFGSGLAISRDGDTMAVGAIGEDSNATGINGSQSNNSAGASGAIYVFTRTGVTWSQQAYVKTSNSQANDEVGNYVGVSLSADGNVMAVSSQKEDSNATGIGGNQADNSATDSGAVYMFNRIGSTWTQTAYVKASNTQANDNFGTVIWLSADGSTLAVGAGNEDSNATGIGGNQANNTFGQSGAVYVF